MIAEGLLSDTIADELVFSGAVAGGAHFDGGLSHRDVVHVFGFGGSVSAVRLAVVVRLAPVAAEEFGDVPFESEFRVRPRRCVDFLHHAGIFRRGIQAPAQELDIQIGRTDFGSFVGIAGDGRSERVGIGMAPHRFQLRLVNFTVTFTARRST